MRTAAALAILFLAQTPGPPPASVEAPAIPGVIVAGDESRAGQLPRAGHRRARRHP